MWSACEEIIKDSAVPQELIIEGVILLFLLGRKNLVRDYLNPEKKDYLIIPCLSSGIIQSTGIQQG